jgi:hypothetical protein
MSIRALNHLLGRSTIDPTVAEAYEQGSFDEILAQYPFSAEVLHRLKALRADSFTEFAAQALTLVLKMEIGLSAADAPDPRQGLSENTIFGDEEQAA